MAIRLVVHRQMKEYLTKGARFRRIQCVNELPRQCFLVFSLTFLERSKCCIPFRQFSDSVSPKRSQNIPKLFQELTLASVQNSNEILREKLSMIPPQKLDQTLHELLHHIIINKNDSTQLFNNVVDCSMYGTTIREKIARTGRIIKLARGRDNIGSLSLRILDDDDDDDNLNDELEQDLNHHYYSSTSEYGKINGSKLVSKLVEFCEDQASDIKNYSVPKKQIKRPFHSPHNYFDDLMYVYCQAGFLEDANAMWHLFIQEFNYLPRKASVSGFVKLCCHQVIEEGIFLKTEDHIPLFKNENHHHHDAIRNLFDLLAFIKQNNLPLMIGPMAKSLEFIMSEISQDVEEEEEIRRNNNNKEEYDLSLERLNITLKLMNAFEMIGVEPRRRSYTSLLRLCSYGFATSKVDEMFKLIKMKSLVKEQEEPNKFKKTNLFTSNHHYQRNNKSKTMMMANTRRKDNHPSFQGSERFLPPTRYEYCLYISALSKRNQLEGKVENSDENDSSMKEVCDEMAAAGLLPLSDSGIIKRASQGDLQSLEGALLIKQLTGDVLNMRLVTKLMSLLITHSNSYEEDMNHSPSILLAWNLWTKFQECSEEDEKPDLRMYNVALTVAARMGKLEWLDSLYLSLLCTKDDQITNHINIKDNQEEEEQVYQNISLKPTSSTYLQPDIYTYNILIDAYGRNHRLDLSLEIFDEMKFKGIPPDVVTYNSLAKAYVRENRLDDALSLIKEAAEQGVAANYITYRTLCHAFGDSNAMLNHLHDQELKTSSSSMEDTGDGLFQNIFKTKKEMKLHHQNNNNLSSSLSSSSVVPYGSDYGTFMKNITSWNESSDTCSLSLDLHKLNISEAKMKISIELEFLHQFYQEEYSENKTNQKKYIKNETSLFDDTDDDENDNEDDENRIKKNEILPDLILITGVGKHSLKKVNKGAMKFGIIEYLKKEGLVFYEVPGNPGRLVISSIHLNSFFERYRIRKMHTSFSDYLSLRYMILPSVLASAMILPKVSEFYSTFMS